MHEVELLRLPVVFGRAHAAAAELNWHEADADATLSEGGAVVTKAAEEDDFRCAASKVVMRSGRHFAQFTVMSGSMVLFGVIRPGNDVEGGRTRTL